MNPYLDSIMGGQSIGGIQIRTNPLLTETVQHSRSPSRARRRRKRGFPQHYITRPLQKAYFMDGVLYCHPAIYAAIKSEILAFNRT